MGQIQSFCGPYVVHAGLTGFELWKEIERKCPLKTNFDLKHDFLLSRALESEFKKSKKLIWNSVEFEFHVVFKLLLIKIPQVQCTLIIHGPVEFVISNLDCKLNFLFQMTFCHHTYVRHWYVNRSFGRRICFYISFLNVINF